MLDDISGSHMLLWICPLNTLKSNFTVGIVFLVASAGPTKGGMCYEQPLMPRAGRIWLPFPICATQLEHQRGAWGGPLA